MCFINAPLSLMEAFLALCCGRWEGLNSLDFVNLKQHVSEEKIMLPESLALFRQMGS